LLYSSDIRVFWLKDRKLLTKGQKSESMAVQGRLQGKFFVPFLSAKPFHCHFLKSQTNTCIIAEIQRAFSFLWVHGEFKYFSFISSWKGNDTLFGSWWNWKVTELQDMWRGTMHFWLLQEVPYKGDIQLNDAGGRGGRWSLYILPVVDGYWHFTGTYASVFRVEMHKMRSHFGYLGVLQGRWPIWPRRGEKNGTQAQYSSPSQVHSFLSCHGRQMKLWEEATSIHLQDYMVPTQRPQP
jgi:hypothetical protein